MFDFLKKTARVTVSTINVKWRGSTHTLGKLDVKGKTFIVSIPFENKPQEDYNLTFLKKQQKPPIVISSLSVRPPFKFVSVEPGLPINAKEGEKLEIKAKIEAPDMNYEGPLDIELVSDTAQDMAHVEITKVMVAANGKSTQLQNKPVIADMTKGQVFKQSVHLYGIVEFGTEVKKIEVEKPFAFVGSDPKLPFTLDKKTGFLIDVFVQAPLSNYGGPLEIKIS